MKENSFFSYIAIVTAVIFWGISYISTDICLEYMEPVTLAAIRCVIAALLLIIIWKIREPKSKINAKHIPRLIISGIIGIVCYFICEINGVKYTSPSVAAIILASIPIISLIVQSISGREKMTGGKIAGVIISLAGVVLVMGIGIEDVKSNGETLGYLFMLGAALSWVVFNYITYPLYQYYSPLTITTFQMIAGAIGIIPIFIITGERLPHINFIVSANVVFLAVFCSAVGILLYMYAFRTLGLLTTTLFINIQPLITVIASMVILKEFLSFNQIAGGLLVITAVYLSTFRKRNLKIVN